MNEREKAQLRQWYKENGFRRIGKNHVSDKLNIVLEWSKHPYLESGKWLVRINGKLVMAGKNYYRQFNNVWQATQYAKLVTKCI